MGLFNRLCDSAFLAFVFVFPTYLISVMVTSSKKRREKSLEKAITRKHVVRASLIKKVYLHPNTVESIGKEWGHSEYRAYYEYFYNGRKYKFKMDDDNPPHNLTLYFLKNPRKATIEECLSDSEVSWPIVYLIVMGIIFFADVDDVNQ